MKLGIQNGKLASCPKSPNCVSTQAPGPKHKISPLHFKESLDEAKAKLIRVIASYPRTKIILNEGNYLHVNFHSLFFRFVDDVEFLIDEKTKTIDFRSASRVGYSDLGANRRRMEEIRKRFQISS